MNTQLHIFENNDNAYSMGGDRPRMHVIERLSHTRFCTSGDSPTPQPPLPGNGHDPSLPPKRKDRRLLIVDDDDIDREKINRCLKKLKFPVQCTNARSGTEALKQIDAQKIDLLVVDYQLGDMTGTELLSKIKEHHDPAIPAIMVTGMGDEQTAVHALRLGVYDYIPKKNLTPEILTTTMEAALRQAELEENLRRANEELRRLSLYDELTGLPNRTLFFDRLHQAILKAERSGGKFSLLMIDLNLFKEVNDGLGHAAGDDVLATVGERLRCASRKTDTIARLGGDEFVCLLNDMHGAQSVCAYANKIIESISEPIALDEHVVQVGASVGIARYPEHGREAATLLSNADNAMYKAKQGLRKYVLYDKIEDYSGETNLPVSRYLNKAIADRELILNFQPKIRLDTHEVIGVEALVRWNSPDFGLVMPDKFIPSAERSSLIERLTYATLDMAMDQIERLNISGYAIPMALNLSARMLDDKFLTSRVIDALSARGIAPDLLTLEITETALASGGASTHRLLKELNEANIQISIDDFGTGFTSFRYIRDVKLSEIKIDRLFVNEIDSRERDAAIVRAMIYLANSLDIRVVAEGIETRAQWDLLYYLGCKYGQGFGIARPMPAEAFMQWLADWNKPNPS